MSTVNQVNQLSASEKKALKRAKILEEQQKAIEKRIEEARANWSNDVKKVFERISFIKNPTYEMGNDIFSLEVKSVDFRICFVVSYFEINGYDKKLDEKFNFAVYPEDVCFEDMEKFASLSFLVEDVFHELDKAKKEAEKIRKASEEKAEKIRIAKEKMASVLSEEEINLVFN